MKIQNTSIEDVKILEPTVFGDERGFFMETFRHDWFKEHVADFSFVQANHSCSSKGILRGLHYQICNPQGKLVRVVSGEVYDVAVDIRKSSTTFGKSVAVFLSSENKKQLWVPPGFAHGFYVVSEFAEFVYQCTDYYAPEYERSLKWDDPTLEIAWPIVDNCEVQLSEKDKNASYLDNAEVFK